jgi:Zn-dependent protease
MLTTNPRLLVLLLPAVLVAVTVHEFAHALVADMLGDPTPRRLGRLTLNPLAHLDFFGTLFFVLFSFGWARPVPVNPQNFAHPRQGMLQVALAGPLANVTVAFAVGLLLKTHDLSGTVWATLLASMVVWINVVLAVFNLIPIPPLDGSRILEGLLPLEQAAAYARIQPYGTLLIFVLLYTGVVGRMMFPAARWLYGLSTGAGFTL